MAETNPNNVEDLIGDVEDPRKTLPEYVLALKRHQHRKDFKRLAERQINIKPIECEFMPSIEVPKYDYYQEIKVARKINHALCKQTVLCHLLNEMKTNPVSDVINRI